MHRWPLKVSVLIAGVWLFTGCRPEPRSDGPQIIYAGLGVSNQLQVGMTLQEIGARNDDVQVARHWKPDTRPWEKLFQKPRTFDVTIDSRGASLFGFDERQTFGEIAFHLRSLPATLLRVGTNEIPLSARQTVSFEEILRRFGPPAHIYANSPTQSLTKWINAGQSVIWSNQNRVHLYLPAQGVFFHFHSNVLETFSITRKFTDTNVVTKP